MNGRLIGYYLGAALLVIGVSAQAGGSGGKPLTPAEKKVLKQALKAADDPRNQKTASQVFCYCGCDKKANHENLMDCHKVNHLPDCPICRDEFLRVDQMNNRGATLADVQNQIDSEFGPKYPFPQPTPILKRYQATKGGAGYM